MLAVARPLPAAPAPRAASAFAAPASGPPSFEAVQHALTGGVCDLTARLGALATLPPEARDALGLLDGLAARLTPDNSLETKKAMRASLWTLRQACTPQAPPLETRRSFERLRSACLDISWERSLRAVPHDRCVVGPNTGSVANFDVVGECVMRGAKPTQEGADWLVARGVRTVIDLTNGEGDAPWAPVAWKNVAHVHIPVPDYTAPSYDQLKTIAAGLDAATPEAPTFIHCKAGIGRTGVAVACWRVTQGWSPQQAVDAELLNSYDASWQQAPAVFEFARRWAAERHVVTAAPQRG